MTTLLIASESSLFRFNLVTGEQWTLAALEAEKPDTRSNDGRADPQGGFWIGTMGKKAEPGMGAIWRFYRGELRKLFPGISIPNSICFTPDGRTAHFSDSAQRKVMRVALDAEGWPVGRAARSTWTSAPTRASRTARWSTRRATSGSRNGA